MRIKKKPTVLLISFVFSPNIGGVESHLDDLVESLCKKGYTITVVTYQPIISNKNAPSFEKKKNLEIRRISWLKFNLFNILEKTPFLEIIYVIPGILLYSIWYLIFHRKKIDVIQAHGFNMAIVGCVLSIVFGKRLVVNTHVSFHFNKGTLYSLILKNVLNRASKILVLTENAGKELAKIGVKKAKIVVYHQWIDTKLFYPHPKNITRNKLRIPDSFIVLFTGRFISQKGVDILVSASEKLEKNIKVIFVGSGPLADFIKNQAARNSSIHFVGEIPKEHLPLYYSSADVCIIPSIQGTKTYAEGIPRVMIESFTCGTPVIATKSGGLYELITKNVGFFIEPTVSSIYKAITQAYRQRKKIKSMSQNCIQYARQQFDKEKNIKIIEKSLYE